MAKTKFIVNEVPGAARSSERPYTHAVIGRRDGRCNLAKLQTSQPGELEVLQWSMSLKNAMKSVATHQRHHSDVRVVECQRVVKADGDSWRVLSTGSTDEQGRTYCHLASLTRTNDQANGAAPIQCGLWLAL